MTLNAFPSNLTSNTGMTLRDYFAAKAMQIAVYAHPTEKADALLKMANWAYETADAMLQAREQGEPS